MLRPVIATLAVFLFGLTLFAQTERVDIPTLEDVYLARDDGKGKAGEEAGDFLTTDIPIYCVVVLDSTAAVTVKMNFVAVKVGGVKTDTKVVSAVYTTKAGQNRVNFTGKPYDVWTPGKYRVDIFLNNKIVRGLEFEIKAAVDRSLAGRPHPETVPTEPVKEIRKP